MNNLTLCNATRSANMTSAWCQSCQLNVHRDKWLQQLMLVQHAVVDDRPVIKAIIQQQQAIRTRSPSSSLPDWRMVADWRCDRLRRAATQTDEATTGSAWHWYSTVVLIEATVVWRHASSGWLSLHRGGGYGRPLGYSIGSSRARDFNIDCGHATV